MLNTIVSLFGFNFINYMLSSFLLFSSGFFYNKYMAQEKLLLELSKEITALKIANESLKTEILLYKEGYITTGKSVTDATGNSFSSVLFEPSTLKLVLASTLVVLGVGLIMFLFSSNASEVLINEYPNIMRDHGALLENASKGIVTEIAKHIDPQLEVIAGSTLANQTQCTEIYKIVAAMQINTPAFVATNLLSQITGGGFVG